MSKNTIIELSEEMSNLIAAGEVVERPSSVIKELVENSLDANAHAITIELENGGLKKMVVSDNGIGMTKEELPLAIKRHATSKIKSPQDLFNITTLGFRGEALPSIASVSKFTIASSTNELDGYKMIYHGGTIITESPVGMTKGTKVEVVDLFYNTPARFKHLSSMTVELSHIVNYINRQALARPEIAFKLSNNGKQILKTSGDGNIEEIISETFGYEVAKNIIPFEGHNDLYQIKGFTTTNVINRSNRNGINLIINGRIIKNLNLTYAITDAYQTILPTGKYPITILEISCDPSFIDVNVHPSKMEIRFTDEFKLRDLITKTISVAITKKELITDQLALSSIEQEHKSTSLCEDEQKKVDELPSETLWEMFECAPDQENKKDEELKMNEENSAYSFAEDMESEETKINEQLEIPSLLKEEPHHFFQNFTYIGQFLKTYLLMEYDENLYLIDQHAAMERFMYEKISQELSIDHHETYELIVPIHLEYNLSVVPLIMGKTIEFKKMGISLEQFGPTTVIIRSVPIWIPKKQVNEFLRDIIDNVINNRLSNKAKMYDNLAKTLSCKKSIKANMNITDLEVLELMKKLDECKMPYTCPHGRPTIIKFTKYELEKMFKRVL